jgi:hypothetical protein
MSNFTHRLEKLQHKRKKTSRRQFVMEVCSRTPMMFYKIDGQISRFPKTGREWKVCSIKEYEHAESVECDYDGDFFANYADLFRRQPKMIIQQWFDNINSSYAEVYGGKNVYLSFGVGQEVENLMYSVLSHTSLRNIYNSLGVIGNCNNIYSSKIVSNAYNVFYSSNIHDSSMIRFSSNLLGCSECIRCTDLQNQSYCIENKQYEKEEYLQKKQSLLAMRDQYDLREKQATSVEVDNKLSEQVQWAWLVQCEDIIDGYYSKRVKHAKNIYFGWWEFGGEHFYDAFDAGNQKDEHLYGVNSVGETSSHVYMVYWWANCNYVFYSYHLQSCSYCLWCIGLKNKSYCILNKQYTKEEWFRMIDKIFGDMENSWVLGNFFPATINPFYFNDTAAYLIDKSFSKNELTSIWYLWRDDPIKVDGLDWVNCIPCDQLSTYEYTDNQGQFSIDQSICEKTIITTNWDAYRIMPMEHAFLQKFWLLLPRTHRQERISKNLQL